MSNMTPQDRSSIGDRIHDRRDKEKLRYHLWVAERLAADPDSVLQVARENLRRWLKTDRDSKPYFEEWERILRDHTAGEITEIITADNAEGRRLRQSSPFIGFVSDAERDSIVSQQ